MLDALIEALGASPLHLDAEQIADSLWLAAYIRRTAALPAVPTNTVEAAPPAGPTPTPPAPAPGQQQTDDAARHQRTQTHQTRPAPGATADLFTTPPTPGGGTATLLTVSGAPALAAELEIARALRPLARRIPTHTARVLDEAATATQIAETGLWQLVFRPAVERWLDVALVVDDTPAMPVWHATILSFQRLLERHGAFRSTRLYTLRDVTDQGRPSVSIFRSLTTRPTEPLQHDLAIIHERGERQLVLMLSDASGPLWRTGRMYALLKRWSAVCRVALIPLLPSHLWDRTVLGAFPRTVVRAQPGAAWVLLAEQARPQRRQPAAEGIILPVGPLDPGGLGRLAQLLAGESSARTPGLLFDQRSVPIPVTRAPRSPDALVDQFLAGASPEAALLAGLFALAAPLTLPVMRLIQHALLPVERHADLAEVLLSGLLRPGADPAAGGERSFTFAPEVRRQLQATIPMAQWLEVLTIVGAEIAARYGLPDDFQSWLTAGVPLDTNDDRRPFARLAAEVLERLGGTHTELARDLAQASGQQPAETSAQARRALLAPEEHAWPASARSWQGAGQQPEQAGRLLRDLLQEQLAQAELSWEALAERTGIDADTLRYHLDEPLSSEQIRALTQALAMSDTAREQLLALARQSDPDAPLISFGEGQKYGDVVIGNIAGGDIVSLVLTVALATEHIEAALHSLLPNSSPAETRELAGLLAEAASGAAHANSAWQIAAHPRYSDLLAALDKVPGARAAHVNIQQEGATLAATALTADPPTPGTPDLQQVQQPTTITPGAALRSPTAYSPTLQATQQPEQQTPLKELPATEIAYQPPRPEVSPLIKEAGTPGVRPTEQVRDIVLNNIAGGSIDNLILTIRSTFSHADIVGALAGPNTAGRLSEEELTWLATILTALVRGEPLPEDITSHGSLFSLLVYALTGKRLSAQPDVSWDSIFHAGVGNQFGDVTIGSVAEGCIFEFALNTPGNDEQGDLLSKLVFGDLTNGGDEAPSPPPYHRAVMLWCGRNNQFGDLVIGNIAQRHIYSLTLAPLPGAEEIARRLTGSLPEALDLRRNALAERIAAAVAGALRGRPDPTVEAPVLEEQPSAQQTSVSSGFTDGPLNLIMTARGPLTAQHGESGTAAVLASISELIAAREAAGVRSHLWLTDSEEERYGLPAIGADSEKLSITIAQFAGTLETRGDRLGSILIIGSPDVIPSPQRRNPLPDGDASLAVDDAYGSAENETQPLPLRAVGRLPLSPQRLGEFQALIERIAQAHRRGPRPWQPRVEEPLPLLQSPDQHTQRGRAEEAWLVALSTERWQAVTEAVIAQAGLAGTLLSFPPTTTETLDWALLERTRILYANLFGIREQDTWYGQEREASTLIPALRIQDVLAHPWDETIIVSQVAFAGLVERKTAETSLALAFLARGALAFFGSTALSYGAPTPPPGESDQLATELLRALVTPGTTLGNTLLTAKNAYARAILVKQRSLDADDLKTLLSFQLLGDPELLIA